MEHNPENLNQDPKLQTTGDDTSGELFENLDRDEQEKRRKIIPLKQSLKYLFGGDSFLNYHEFTKKEMESGRGTALYTIIKYNNEDTLVYIGSGEFNIDVFNMGGIPELKGLHNTPLPLFIISQSNSFSLEREGVESDIRDYLKNNSIIVVPRKGEAYLNKYGPKKNQINFNNINIKHLKDAINETRLAILHKEFPNGQFKTGQNNCIDIIQKLQSIDFDQFYNTVRKNKQYLTKEMERVLGCFRHMGINLPGSGVGDRKAYQALYDLIQSFNLQNESF